MKNISEKIRDALLECDESLREVARATGIDVGQLSRFRAGASKLGQDALDSLADYLGLTICKRGRR